MGLKPPITRSLCASRKKSYCQLPSQGWFLTLPETNNEFPPEKLMIHWLEGYNFLEGIYQSLYMNVTCNYCWWKKSCTSWYGKYPIIYKVLYMPGGAGFLPSTVSQMYWEFSCSATLCCQEAAYQAETFWMGRQHDLSLLHRGGSIVKRGNPPKKKHTEKQTSGGTPFRKNAKKTMWCVCHPVFEFFQILVEEELWRANARLKVHVLTKNRNAVCLTLAWPFTKASHPQHGSMRTHEKLLSWLAWHEVFFAWLARTSWEGKKTGIQKYPGWWQLKYFMIFLPKIGEDAQFSSKGLVQPPTNTLF